MGIDWKCGLAMINLLQKLLEDYNKLIPFGRTSLTDGERLGTDLNVICQLCI